MSETRPSATSTDDLASVELAYIEGGVTSAIRKIKPSLAAVDFKPDMRFDDLDISSLEVITIVFEIEDFFDIQIVDRNLDDLRTYGEACAVVVRLLAARSVSGAGSAR